MIVAWVLFPLVLAAVGLGWGLLIERAAGARVNDALLVPLGLAGALVAAGTLTAFGATARAAPPVVAVGAGVGVLASWRAWRLSPWPLLAAAGVLLAYGAPVLLSGHATFTGFVKLDDTATWFNVVDHVMAHARSVSGEPASTYRLLYTGDVGPSYPLGAFMLAGVGRSLVGANVAWVFQPYLACCAAALSLCAYALLEPLVATARMRALLAFFAAQPALLFGYSLWGGIKEMTAALMLALGVALAAPLLARRPPGARGLLPLAVAAAALIQTLGPGAGGWVAPALLLVAQTPGRVAHLNLRTRVQPFKATQEWQEIGINRGLRRFKRIREARFGGRRHPHLVPLPSKGEEEEIGGDGFLVEFLAGALGNCRRDACRHRRIIVVRFAHKFLATR